MRNLIRLTSLLVLCVLPSADAYAAGQTKPPRDAKSDDRANPDALVLADFKKRIDAYLELHGDVDKGTAEAKETNHPSEIRSAQQTLAKRIRAARANAKHGDIFTPEIRTAFRRLMYPETVGTSGRRTKEAIEEDAPAAVPLKVNAQYPEGAALPTVPGNLLANLPQLPEDLEYRIVDKHLILRDVDANLIVDYIPNAIR
jgi:hypothetical protein